MNVSVEILERIFNDFSKFVDLKDDERFTTFRKCRYFNEQEGYKQEIYKEAKNILSFAQKHTWKEYNIGTGVIHKTLSNVVSLDINNINRWSLKNHFKRITLSPRHEKLLYDFYKNKGVKNEVVFTELIKYGISYNLTAYLFFIKDKNRFLPISQKAFDKIFKQIGITDFKTNYQGKKHDKPSWSNYSTFIDIIKQVRTFLQTKDKKTTLLDAHSFLWIIGNQMQEENFDFTSTSTNTKKEKEQNDETNIEEYNESIIPLEDEDEITFPEGKESYHLHRRKERSQKLIRAVKRRRLQIDPKLCCDVCGFSFIEKYGKIGEGFIEAHHLFPISELTEETKIEDIALVCSNCHRMLHRKRPWITVGKLKSLLQ